MRVHVRLFATLREGRVGETDVSLHGPNSVRDLLSRLKISESEASLVLVDGQHAELNQDLHDGQTVSLFPPIGGG